MTCCLFHFPFRSGLFTDIFLVLIVSITCVQTKEIKNSSVFQQISDTNHSSIETLSTLDTRFHDHAHDNHTWSHPTIDNPVIHPSNLNHSAEENITAQQNNQIKQIDAQIRDTKYSIEHINNSLSNNEAAQFELPTKIDSTFYISETVRNEPAHERNSKKSNIFRSALRVAARQGLEAMVELYDKKEPNLIKKGQFHVSKENQFDFIDVYHIGPC